MLRSLYNYGVDHKLILPPGYVNKTVKVYIQLCTRNDCAGIFLNDGEAIPCPDIGSLSNGIDKSNILVEKRSVVLPDQPTVKGAFFLESLRDAADHVPLLECCVKFFENSERVLHIRTELDRNKIKPSDRISFMVDGTPIVMLSGIKEWWLEFRKQFQAVDTVENARCLITGENTVPVSTTAKIQGLRAVGGHSSGDTLICFDKPAFQSYGLDKAANAPVSEKAFSVVKAALENLLEDAPILAGMKFVHWYDRDISPEDDLFQQLGFISEQDEDEEEDTFSNTAAERERHERDARRKADSLIQNIKNSTAPIYNLSHTNYFILLLTGVGGRVMIRRFEQGNYAVLQKNLELWHSDLSLVNIGGTASLKGSKLAARLIRLLKYQKNDSNPFGRLDKELSGTTPAIITAILTGGQIPDCVGVRALAYIRSKILSADSEDKAIPIPDSLACQWLKVWLMRKNRQEDFLMEKYNMSFTQHPAYHCGGIMAVYAAIQNAAMPNVNVGVVQRYYASASQTPAIVLGKLATLSAYYLSKIENRWLADQYQKKLEELYTLLDCNIPVVLAPEEQAYFALGYYQMCAKMNYEKTARKAAKEQKETANAENMED